MGCSCKGDLSGTCKHIIAVLLYCNRNDLESLQMITYTDKKCVGNQPHKSSLEKYEAKPLDEHECFSMSRKKILNTKYRKKNPYETKANDDNTKSKDSDENFQLSEEENTKIRNLMNWKT
ncbi:PREDICTED: uncharacterized protein LOC107071386 isoform X2 [Polistes dominula]|uniref:Uncharacterized protein LOC107071386 isoform X2 n=1 Tax=Polistes dominula TaxID=743375 RepID=A0ABM1J052_POLDO|nr:PREDICTED: uncharacterized protein LOC107071386 isoform X2 [Polistes dominula]